MPVENNAQAAAGRLDAFKNKGKDSEDLRRRRNEVSVELRKAKKDDMMSKRRNIDILSDDEFTSPSKENQGPNSKTEILMNPEEIKAAIEAQDDASIFLGTQSARRILSKEKNPPIDQFIEMGIIPRLVHFLARADNPKLQFEAAWALTNIASGNSDQTKAVVDAGSVQYFVELLKSPDSNVCEQAVWALGNIAGDGSMMRDYVISCGALKPLMNLANSQGAAESFLRNVTWSLSNLCRNKDPSPSLEVIKTILPTLSNLLDHSDTEIRTDACWALSYLSDGDNSKIQCVVDSGVVRKLVAALASGEVVVMTPALRALGNIVTGTDEHTDAVIDAQGIPYFISLLRHQRSNIVKEAAWTLSNITAGNPDQIQAFIDANGMGPICEVLEKGDFKCQKEAVWTVVNLSTGGIPQQIAHMVEIGVLKPLCELLEAKDDKTVGNVLDCLTNIMETARQHDNLERVSLMVEEAEGLDKIEELQQHENEVIYKKALEIIQNFFPDEDDVADLGAGTDGNGGFQFSVNDQQQQQQQQQNPSSSNGGGQFNF